MYLILGAITGLAPAWRGEAAPKGRGMVQQMLEEHLLHHPSPECERCKREHAAAVRNRPL